ncbi:hypothetical protein EDC18_10541 [Natranaerovirga pectinivora]|uniref:WG repeat protein n=1 Tax=Natranaerovirga pectinivora TaxID=682400 RepID=A0A4R3MQ78_9FIRM|nr:hypothetical protein [Natranaerovirga pectinivora]TCT14560.1 hypothetical protein EDC18_10541 [Natranaerovirga pectinivora]
MKKLLIVLFLLVLMAFSACSQINQQDAKSAILNTINSQEVKEIKSLVDEESGYTLGKLIDSSLSSPTYELYDPAKDGKKYVTISGVLNFKGVDVVATLQYKSIGEGEYEFYTLVYNDIPANNLETVEFFRFLRENVKDEKEVITESKVLKIDDVHSGNSDASNEDEYEEDLPEGDVPKSNILTISLQTELRRYEFGNIEQFTYDFNGDGVDDIVEVYFEQYTFWITFIDGATNIGYVEEFFPLNLYDENGYALFDAVEIAVLDLDFNYDLEVIIGAVNNGYAMGGLAIADFIDGSIIINDIEGQYEFVITNDGNIIVPFGSQGLADVYSYYYGDIYDAEGNLYKGISINDYLYNDTNTQLLNINDVVRMRGYFCYFYGTVTDVSNGQAKVYWQLITDVLGEEIYDEYQINVASMAAGITMYTNTWVDISEVEKIKN